MPAPSLSPTRQAHSPPRAVSPSPGTSPPRPPSLSLLPSPGLPLPPPPPAPPIPEVARRYHIAHLLHSLQLVVQTLAATCLFVLVSYMTFNDADEAAQWSWLWELASPALVFLLMLSLSSLLIHQINCLSVVAHVWFQGGCLGLAAFSAALVIYGCLHAKNRPDDPLSVTVVLAVTLITWFTFFAGFIAAALVYWRHQKELQAYLKGKRIQIRGATEAAAYGTFSDDGGDIGIDGILEGSP